MIVSSEAQLSADQTAAMEALAARVANSPQLHGSPKLREFFLYVIDCALRQAPEEATEQQIGVHVFRRRPGYNSGDDSIVRSQARLLRAKVTAYFANEGSSEPIVIEIPKGQYFPVFRAAEVARETEKPQSAAPQPAFPDTRTVEDSATAAPAVTRRRWLRSATLAAAALALGFSAGDVWKATREHPVTPVLDAFWKPFYASNNSLVIYSNPVFMGNPTDGLRIVRPDANGGGGNSTDSRQPLDETYTGTGEVEAIHTLTELFNAHKAHFTLKRGKLVTWDDARSRSLLFIGRSEPEQRLNDLHPLTQFYITETPDHQVYIANKHPRAGDPAAFSMQSPTQETAIVALLAGLKPGTRVAVFSGISTVGTQEAVDFMAQPDSIRTLINTVGTDNGLLKPFEAVLRIDTSGGVPIDASFLAIHKR